jgi:hypothetical protein
MVWVQLASASATLITNHHHLISVTFWTPYYYYVYVVICNGNWNVFGALLNVTHQRHRHPKLCPNRSSRRRSSATASTPLNLRRPRTALISFSSASICVARSLISVSTAVYKAPLRRCTANSLSSPLPRRPLRPPPSLNTPQPLSGRTSVQVIIDPFPSEGSSRQR